MDIRSFKMSHGIRGNRTDGNRHSTEAQNIIEATWYDDPASTVGYLYSYEYDDEPSKNKGLHPELSKTKTMVELKYILSSYRTLNKDEVDVRIMFKPSYRCNVPYYKDLFQKHTDSVFPTGLYLDLQDEKGVWNRWLVVATADAINNDFPTWSILPCGHRFQWVFDGKKCQVWGVERSQSSYTSGVWLDRIFESPDNITKCIMPYNYITKNLFYNDRMIISVDLLEPLAWRVSKVEPFATRGNILYTFKEDVFDEHHDYIERNDDGDIIGMWANYYKESNLPSDNSDDLSPDEYDTYAVIDYAGAEPHIKVNGSYKKITLTYYNSNITINDQTPGEWSYIIDDEDARSLVKVMETESPNILKLKFLGDETYIGKVLIVKNKRDNIVAELRLQIVAI